MSRKIGRFKVAGLFFRNLAADEGANLFHGMVILDVRHCWGDEVEYFAMHPDFRLIATGEIVPEYRAIFDSISAVPQWEEVSA